MERNNLICCLIGFYSGLNPDSDAMDIKIKIDEHLIRSHLTPLGTEEGDMEILENLTDEAFFSVLAQGFNRKARRSVK